MITVLSVNRSARPKSNISEDVAVPDDTFLTEFRDYSLEKTISGIESRLDTEVISDEEDVMPSAAAEMGAGNAFSLDTLYV